MARALSRGGWGAFWGLFFALLLLTAGCGGQQRTGGTVSVMSPDFFGLGENLARQLKMNHRQALAAERVIMTSLVPLDSLENPAGFGLIMTEALATQLFHHGVEVIETRKARAIVMRDDQGELVLSRDGSSIARQQEATAIVAGTYSLTPQTVIVNIRLLSAASSSVLSVAGMEIQRSPAINALLAQSVKGNALELSAYEINGG